ncbi:cob(I)yrinic acid a,c-diamide adenosyltransferase [uncultured Desulfovibrio sp.]|uniref:cob(I)yrinic acid a,c-diamide adenosyltransferase n=1 Tax=uncultured Desulfovibrio sp. TaxID=167968 RepID=UPI0025D661BD|nr:cob(I)yrinic acid a,c-diamide adenosyltransferase [uncultured Desulfovibrio sp.]
MILIYTGNGKGKTSACVGQALRALGQELRVGFGQFMKKDVRAGEQVLLERLLGENFRAGGRGFFRREEEREEHRAAARTLLSWARERLPRLDMLVLDESLYALRAGLLERAEVEALLREARELSCHLVLSGRDAPQWLMDMADLVTDMGEVKHPAQSGVKAQRGIEF